MHELKSPELQKSPCRFVPITEQGPLAVIQLFPALYFVMFSVSQSKALLGLHQSLEIPLGLLGLGSHPTAAQAMSFFPLLLLLLIL